MDYPGIEDALKNKIGAIERIAAMLLQHLC